MLQKRNLSLILFLLIQAPVLFGVINHFASKTDLSLNINERFSAPVGLYGLDSLVKAASEAVVIPKHVVMKKRTSIKKINKVLSKKVALKNIANNVAASKAITTSKEKTFLKIVDKQEHDLTAQDEFKQYAFEVKTQNIETSSWSAYLASSNIDSTLSELEKAETSRIAANAKDDEVIEQTVTESAAAVTQVDFKNDEEADALNILLNEPKSKGGADEDLVLIDYSKADELGDSTSTIKEEQLSIPSNDVAALETVGQAVNKFIPDLSGQDTSLNQEGPAAPMSDAVLEAIARNQNELLAQVDPSLVTSQLASQLERNKKKSNYNFAGLPGKTDKDTRADVNGQNGFVAAAQEDHRLVIQALVGHRGSELEQKAYNYEFIPSFNTTMSLYDNADGEIVINGSLHSDTALFSGSIVKAGFVRTRIEIPVERGYIAQPIALIEQETLLSYFESKNLRGNGGHLFVQLNEQIDDVEIDGAHEEKLFLDEKMEISKDAASASYILFVGVEPGNITITYFHGTQNATKVIGIYEDELFVDTPVLVNTAPSQIKLVERNLMGKSATDLLIDGNKMKSFQSGKESIPLAYNNYEIDHGLRPIGMRNYVEFSNNGAIILGGNAQKETMEVPSRDYMENILRIFKVDDLRSSCMVQINFGDNVESVELNAEGARGAIDYDSLYLDRDGVFNRDASELASKLFISGHEQGIFYLNVNYQDGSKDIFKSFCSLGTYLFEQL